MTHTEWHNAKLPLITYYKFYFLQTENQIRIVITAGNDLIIAIYQFSPTAVTVL